MGLTVEDAKTLLDSCQRYELRDHAFGDSEVTWSKDEQEIAEGYFSSSLNSVTFDDGTVFGGNAASMLRQCGHLVSSERNDTAGPDEYEEGSTMPGLTLEGVLGEITQVPPDPTDHW